MGKEKKTHARAHPPVRTSASRPPHPLTPPSRPAPPPPQQPTPPGGRKATLAAAPSPPTPPPQQAQQQQQQLGAPTPADPTFSVRTLSATGPRAFLWPGVLSAADADALVAVATPRMSPSTLALRPGERAEEKAGIRTSDGTFLAPADDPSGVLAKAVAAAAALTGIPPSHGEAFNLLRYRPGARYEAHYDSFAPDGYGPQASHRIATVLFYLSDVEAGGETVFPLAGPTGAAHLASRAPIDYQACTGLRVRPRKGDALLFYSAHPNGSSDLQALHGGCPVERGEKWVATLWLRDQVAE